MRRERLPVAAAAAADDDRRELATRDRELLALLDAGFEEAARRAGEWLACRPGCTECCHGPFPITPLDAHRLHAGLAELERSDPARARALRRRAAGAVAALSAGFPGDAGSGRLRAPLEELDRFFERHAALPCPALDAQGRCELYRHRPVSCREFGPPLRFGRALVPPCRLCFDGADTEQIERGRYEPDPRDLEGALLALLVDEPGGEWETLIAFALAAAP